MSKVKSPVILDKTGKDIVSVLHRQNLLLDIMAGAAVESASTLKEIHNIVRSGNAPKVFNIGDQIIVPWTDKAIGKTYQVPLDVVHFGNVDVMHSSNIPAMFLQWHYCTPFGVQFDAREAFYTVPEEGMTAGTYHFNVPTAWSKILTGSYQFTVTSALDQGAQLVFRAAYVDVDAGLSGGYIDVYADGASNEVLYSYQITNGSGGTDLGNLIAASNSDLWSLQCANYGYNRWAKSGIRQWLNSKAGIDAWWIQQSIYDRAPAELKTKHGFMSGFEDDFLEILQPIKISTALNTVTDTGIEEDNLEDTFDTFFLPALVNENIEPQLAGEGDVFEYWLKVSQSSTKLARSQTYPQMRTYGIDNINTPQIVRLRSAYRSNAHHTWIVHSSGYVYGSGATNSIRCAPVCAVC